MRNHRTLLAILLLSLSAFLSGCTYRIEDFIYNHKLMVALIVLIIFGFLNLIKLFLRNIQDKKIKSIINLGLIVLAIGIGLLCDLLYTKYIIADPFSVLRGLAYATGSITLLFIEEILKGLTK